MNFSISSNGSVHVVRIKKKFLGSVVRHDWYEQMQALGPAPRLVIDLEATDFMDSSAVGLLIATGKTVRDQGGEVVLANLKKRIKNLLLMMHLLGEVFENYESVEEAERALLATMPAV